MLTDPIADMLTRIRNANRALHESASMPTSRAKEEIARILKDEGYIKDFRVVQVKDAQDKELPFRTLVIELKFAKDRRRVITDLKRVSKPGRRVYARKDRLPRVLGGLGIADHVHLERDHHGPPGRRARRGRRGHRLRLVAACRESENSPSRCRPASWSRSRPDGCR